MNATTLSPLTTVLHMLTLRAGATSLQLSPHSLTRNMYSTMRPRRFLPTRLQRTEDLESYRPGGFHPVSIGDCFAQGRYKVVHKLGHGGSSTVWLARDQQGPGRLVTLKAMRADASSSPPSEIPTLAIPEMLQAALPPSVGIQTVEDHFLVKGPNGSHLFIVFPLAGPSIVAMSDCPGRTSGSRRLRADLARKVAKQITTAIYHIHRAGVVHGGEDPP